MNPHHLTFSKTDEWLYIDGNIATVGISPIVTYQFTNRTDIEFPKVGDFVKIDDPFIEVETLKAIIAIYSPVRGMVTEINTDLNKRSSSFDNRSFEHNWLVKIDYTDISSKLVTYPHYIQKQRNS